MLQIHKKIESERIKAGLTQDEMAEKLGIKRSTYQYWEKKTPGVDKLKQVARVLGKSESYFLTGNDENIGKQDPDPAEVILPTGDIKRTLADYIAIIELYNKTLSSAINAGLIDIKNNLKEAEANLARGQQEIKEQILVTAMGAVQQLSGVVPTAHVPLTKAGKGSGGKKKVVDDNGKNKVH